MDHNPFIEIAILIFKAALIQSVQQQQKPVSIYVIC